MFEIRIPSDSGIAALAGDAAPPLEEQDPYQEDDRGQA